jgi:hypothetical protein
VRGKLAPRYVSPYEITEICGSVAYRMRLPPPLAAIHDIFHVSQLKNCIRVPTEIVEQKEILVEPDLSYIEYLIKVLDQKERVTKRKVVKMYKIQWSHHTEEEATWEAESYLNQNFCCFLNSPKGHHIEEEATFNALQIEQLIGLSGHHPIQPWLHRIDVGLPRMKTSPALQQLATFTPQDN